MDTKKVKERIKVLIRTRPTVNFASKNYLIDEASGSIKINIPKDQSQGYVNHQQENWGFKFDKILQNAPQEVVFDMAAKDIVFSTLEGYSGTIMCYGQTGAGKTFTMSGSSLDYKYRGLIPRIIGMLTQEAQSRYEETITMRVSYTEIYNETMYDLLSPELSSNIAINDDGQGNIVVKGLTQKVCSNEEEMLGYFFEGETNKTISQHKLNANSSRAHSIFTIYIEMRSRVESTEKIKYAKLNLVDLAGSERTKKTGSEGLTMVEASFINRSLSYLEQVVVALSEKQRDHIPYRQSKLTYMLKDSIGGNCKTIMIANIIPEAAFLEETISTLKFATRMMKVSNEASVNIHLDPHVLLKKYEKEIKELKQELAMHDMLQSRGRINYEPYNAEEKFKQQEIAKKYLRGEIDDIEFESLRQVKELFIQFRNLYKELQKDIQNNNVVVDQKAVPVDQSKGGKAQPIQTSTKQPQAGIGTEENKHGFGLGKALKDAKPTSNAEELIRSDSLVPDKDLPSGRQEHVEVKPSDINDPLKKVKEMDKNKVFMEFKEREGKSYNDAVLKNMDDLKNRKQETKDLSGECQKLKEKMEVLKDQIQKKQETKNQEEIQQGIIDEEEYEMIKEMKELKKEYKLRFDKIQALKSEIIALDQNIQYCKQQLLSKFEEYFQRKYLVPMHVALEEQSNHDHMDDLSANPDVDPDALSYIRAKEKMGIIQKAKKMEKTIPR